MRFVENADQPPWHGYMLAAAMFAASFLKTLMNEQYFYFKHLTMLRVQSALMAATYRKVATF
jgi:hypothetical protein